MSTRAPQIARGITTCESSIRAFNSIKETSPFVGWADGRCRLNVCACSLPDKLSYFGAGRPAALSTANRPFPLPQKPLPLPDSLVAELRVADSYLPTLMKKLASQHIHSNVTNQLARLCCRKCVTFSPQTLAIWGLCCLSAKDSAHTTCHLYSLGAIQQRLNTHTHTHNLERTHNRTSCIDPQSRPQPSG